MPSELKGLFKTLEWANFPVRQEAPPKARQVLIAALTETKHKLDFHPEEILGTSKFRLADTVQASIALDRSGSFQKSWVATMPQADRDELLAHEQGHYDIHALLTRDFFLAVMHLRLKEYASPEGITIDIHAAKLTTVDKSAAVQTRYDTATASGMKKAEQAQWKGMISRAFNSPASPPQATLNGTPIGVLLLNVLSQSGFNF